MHGFMNIKCCSRKDRAKDRSDAKTRKKIKKLLDKLKGKKRGYCKLKGEVLKCNLWRPCFGSGYRPVIRHNRMYESTGS